MAFRLIETYSDDDTVTVADQTYPRLCLIEDQDAVRVMLCGANSVPANAWLRAHGGGASAIIFPWKNGLWWVTSEAFMEKREEHPATMSYFVSPGDLTELPAWPDGYIEAMGLTRATQSKLIIPSSSFVHLHAHSEMSALDGYSKVSEMVDLAVADGQGALAVTDHGVCASHPDLHAATTAAGIKPIYGIEANFVSDRHQRSPAKLDISGMDQDMVVVAREAHEAALRASRDYMHLILWAITDEGLRNLWAISTIGYSEGHHYRPRVDWEVLERYAEGVMCSTACLRGPIARGILNDDAAGAEEDLGRLMSIFGDKLYAEIHTNALEDQRKVNTEVVNLAQRHGIPTIAVVDSHYPCADDHHAHKVWLASQLNKDLSDDESLFAGHQDYHLMTTEEVAKALDYLPANVVTESMTNTLAVADRADASLRPRQVMPIYTRPGNYDSEKARKDADLTLLYKLALGTPEDGYANWNKKCCAGNKTNPEQVYQDRFVREMKLLVDKGFVGYYLMVHAQVRWAKDHGCLVGPGRGSGAGSLVAYLLDITTPDPVEADLLFERFLTEGRDEPPDFDVDYPTSWRDAMQDHEMERWGEEHTVRVGTHLRLKSKGVFEVLGRIYKEEVEYRDFNEISNIIDRAEQGAAGLGLSWDELWAQHGDELEVYREKYPDIFDLAEKMRGRLKSYGRHAAGLVISPDEVLTDSLPMRSSDTSHQLISQFDMDALTLLGYIKFDILTLRNLDTLQQCLDLIKARTGETVDVYAWDREYEDPQVWDEICDGNTLGIFQIETSSGTKLTKQFKPRSVSDLSDVITLVRPGPVRSGLTATYFRRREGYEAVSYVDDRLESVLAPTEGCIIYQEQVMRACQVLGGYTLEEADAVRKILGKKKVEKVQEAGVEFISRTTANGMDQAAAEHLWEQLGEFAKYSFNKSHAWCYAMLGYWTAWFKFHYPVEFLTASLSTVKKERVPEFINEARRMGYTVDPPDINSSARGFTAGTMACRYGFEGIDGVGEAAAEAIMVGQPYLSFEDFLERKGSNANKGVVKILARVGAFDSMEPNRRALVKRLEWEASDDSGRCQNKDEKVSGPNGLPCTYDWSSEPVVIGKSGRPLKGKPVPKRCTKACRRYSPPEPPDWESMRDYADVEVREIERELLGTYLSSTPFDVFLPEERDQLIAGSDVLKGPVGSYFVAATISRIKQTQDRNGNEMAFLGMFMQDQEVDVVVFNSIWSKIKGTFDAHDLCLAVVNKNTRGVSLSDTFQPIPAPRIGDDS